MSLTIKRLKQKPLLLVPQPQEDSCFSSKAKLIDFKTMMDFLKQWRLAEGYASQYTVLRTWWPKVCKGDMPKVNVQLLYARIGYELQAKAYIEVGQTVPKSVAQNLEAMKNFDVDKMTLGMKRMMLISIKETPTTGEDPMKKTEVKTPRQGVSQFYLEIFEAQPKAQLTDDQIADIIEKKSGNRPTAKNVASYRFMYNAGTLQDQKTAPVVKVKAIRPKSDKPAKVKKPMSEETKAKLKSYSAAKKSKKKLTIKRK